MREKNEILRDIHTHAAVHTNKHFVYTGDAHGDGYVNYRELGKQEHRPLLREASVLILQGIISALDLGPDEPIVVVGPETLGAQMVRELFFAPHREIPHAVIVRILMKTDSGSLEWGSPTGGRLRDAHVVFVDDILNAGSTFKNKVQPLIEAEGGKTSAIGVIGDRSGLSAIDLGVEHVEALERFTLNRYEGTCPLCNASEPIVRHPGHGYKYEELHPDYPGGFIDL